MSSKLPDEILPKPANLFEFPPDPMVIGRAAATTYLNNVSTAIAYSIPSDGLTPASPNVGMLALAALEFETDIWLLAQGRTPEIVFAPNPYRGGPLDNPTGDSIVQTSNDLIKIAQYIVAQPQAQAQPPSKVSAGEYAQGVGLYVALRNQLRDMIAMLSPAPGVPWAVPQR